VSAGTDARAVPGRRRPEARASLANRLWTRTLIAVAGLLGWLPEGLAQRAADLGGRTLYLVKPARRRQARENLRRVCRWLVANNMANPRTAAAARDERALEHMLRDAFAHYLRGYLESATLPRYASEARLDHVRADDLDLSAQAFPPGRSGPLIIVGLHFGAIEIPGLWATRRLGARITAPMETIGDAGLQAYFERARAKTGMNVIPLAGAAPQLRAALARNEMVALVADRPVGGNGSAVTLFGAPARLPAGPAVLALETDAPAWLIVTRRSGWGDYRSRLERIVPEPSGETRRERLAAFLNAEARAFERAVADAPEQWWTIFFPIWTDAR
jgi:KDO2-lipid IV(A) lauroyltransferase